MKQKLKEKGFYDFQVSQEKQDTVTKVALIFGLVIGGLYFSRYLLNGFAGTVRAFKSVKKAFKE